MKRRTDHKKIKKRGKEKEKYMKQKDAQLVSSQKATNLSNSLFWIVGLAHFEMAASDPNLFVACKCWGLRDYRYLD
jgi:hypothetical protein